MSKKVVLNGKTTDLDGIQHIVDLLESRHLNPRLVAVELNGEIVPRDQFDSTEILDGDKLEIVHFVGGG